MKKNYLLILLGVILGFLFSYLLFFHIKTPVIKNRDDIIAPYYEKTALTPPIIKKPKEIIKRKLKIPIIMYHYVEYISDVNDLVKKKLNINPYTFEQELKSLKDNNWQTYFLKDVPDIISGKEKISSKSAILTFDDGYEDFYTVVFPLLKKYQMKGTIYIIYDFIGRKGFLNEKEITEISKSSLVEIGSHTLDHVYLKSLPISVQKKQIFESKKKLEEQFNIKIETFAYPYGAFTEDTIDLVKQASYSAGVSVIPGAIQSGDNLFFLKRLRAGIFSGANISKILENYNK